MNKLISFLLLILPALASANVAQPGVWSSGGTASFSLLYPEDSASYGKISMTKEKVLVQLYPGFAVVKGTYWLTNTSEDTVSLRAGYPLNSAYEYTGSLYALKIDFDSLFALKVRTDNKATDISVDTFPGTYTSEQLWYTWQNTFLPSQTQIIEIYFIVNTNTSQRIDGYSKSFDNIFVYLIESGATWKQPIGQGEVIIQLMDELNLEKVRGLSPDSSFGYNAQNKILYWSFSDLYATPSHNIVLVYGKKMTAFRFDEIVKYAENYFNEIDKLQNMEVSTLVYLPVDPGNPFSFQSVSDSVTIWFIIIPGFVLFGLVVFFLWRIFRSKKA